MNEQTESLNPDKNEEAGEKLVASQPVTEGESAAEPVVDEAAEAAKAAELQAEQARQRAAFQARVDAAATADPLTFLNMSRVSKVSPTMYRDGHRWYVTEAHPVMWYQGVVRIGMIHIANQAMLLALKDTLAFTTEDLQKAFNNVSIAVVNGASPEQEDLLTSLAMALTDQAWEASIRMRNTLPAILDGLTRDNAEQLRLPLEKDGGAFEGVDLLFEPGAGQFNIFAGFVLKYADVDPTLPSGSNTYTLLKRDIQAATQDQVTDQQIAAVLFDKALISFRNQQTDVAIINDLKNVVNNLVAILGPDILKQTQPPAEAANDTSALDDAALSGDIEGTGTGDELAETTTDSSST